MSLPLREFLGADRCQGVRFHCSEGGHAWDVPIAAVIADLEARGVGGADTPIHDVARFARKACPECGSWRFTTRPAWR